MRRAVPFSMVSTVRDDPRRSGYRRDVIYATRLGGGGLLDSVLPTRSRAISVHQSREHARSREIELAVPDQTNVKSAPRAA
jgi:hypothetical protein